MAKNPDLDIDNPQDDRALSTLAGVTLRSFTTSSERIGPFGSATLRWQVAGVGPDVLLRLNDKPVRAQGSRAVSPQNRTTYVLKARVGRFDKGLGTVTVDVDLGSCQTFEVGIDPDITSALTRRIDSTSGQSLRRQPSVRADSRRRIRIAMDVEVKVNNFRNPTVSIASTFGLEQRDGTVVAVDKATTVGFDWPSEAWLIPGAMIALPLIESSNTVEITNSMNAAMDDFARLADFKTSAPDGMRRRSVEVAPPPAGVNGNHATIATTHCLAPSGPAVFDPRVLVKHQVKTGIFNIAT